MIAVEYIREDGELEVVIIGPEGIVHREVPIGTNLDLDPYTLQVSEVIFADSRMTKCKKLCTAKDDECILLSYDIAEDLLEDPIETYNYIMNN